MMMNGLSADIVEGVSAALRTAMVDTKDGNGVIRTTHNVGFLMSYRVHRVKFSLIGENVLHLRNNEWLTVTNSSTYSQTSFYQQMPGHLMLSIGWQFQ